jgi:hypothetical protein
MFGIGIRLINLPKIVIYKMDYTQILIMNEWSCQCPRCGHVMTRLQTCHLRCKNCGAELTCSDKGLYW